MPVAMEKKVMFAPDCLEKTFEVDDDLSPVLFQTIIPRRRRDRFGRDATSRSDFVLSATVFPTGVRAPALEELQQKCGPVCRVDSLGVGPGSWISQDTLPNAGPKVLTLKKSKRSSRYLHSPRNTPSVSTPSMRSYNWSRTDGKESPRDVRDPMYLNTYCSKDRALRYKETTLPRISQGRPWSVGESNPSRRFVTVNSVRKSTGNAPNRLFRTRVQGFGVRTPRKTIVADGHQQDIGQYFEVKRVPTDQRERTQGQDGCLYSQVKQCIKLVQKHDHETGKRADRPMKSEIGRYRPFSTTSIRTPSSSPAPRQSSRDQESAYTYRHYLLTKTFQAKLHVPNSAMTVVSGVVARNNTVASTYLNSESRVVQSVADSNMPDVDIKSCCGTSQFGDKLSDSGIFGLDIRGATFSASKSGKTRTDSSHERTPFSSSPKKNRVSSNLSRSRQRTADRTNTESSVHFVSEDELEDEPVPIQLDEYGNPTIWNQSPVPFDTPDSDVIKIPAAMANLSMDETEDTDEAV